MVKTGAAAWQFRWYTGQLGDDLRDDIVFSLGYDNMALPTLRRNRLREATKAIVAGQGEGDARLTAVRTGANYDGTWNSREVVVDARQYTTLAGLQNVGDQRLKDFEARDNLQFQVVETESTRFRRDYHLGALVTTFYQGIELVQEIHRTRVIVEPGSEQVDRIELSTRNA